MNREHVRQLIEKVRPAIDATGIGPVLTLEEFFTDNHWEGSIGCNLSEHPGVEVFAHAFYTLRDMPDVHEVWVGITDYEDLLLDEEIDPADLEDEVFCLFSDTVYIYTTLSPDTVAAALELLQPTDVNVVPWESVLRQRDHPTTLHHHLPEPPDGYHILLVWWD